MRQIHVSNCVWKLTYMLIFSNDTKHLYVDEWGGISTIPFICLGCHALLVRQIIQLQIGFGCWYWDTPRSYVEKHILQFLRKLVGETGPRMLRLIFPLRIFLTHQVMNLQKQIKRTSFTQQFHAMGADSMNHFYIQSRFCYFVKHASLCSVLFWIDWLVHIYDLVNEANLTIFIK